MEKSLRKELVESTVESVITDNLFATTNEFKKMLEDRLNSILTFKTQVSEVNFRDDNTYGNVSFEDETNSVRVIEFTFTNNSVSLS